MKDWDNPLELNLEESKIDPFLQNELNEQNQPSMGDAQKIDTDSDPLVDLILQEFKNDHWAKPQESEAPKEIVLEQSAHENLTVAKTVEGAKSSRVRVDDKSMLNSRADVNQLVPIKYHWAWESYLTGCANHWMPTEVPMTKDIETWRDPNGLTDDERLMLKRNLGFFASSESLVANNIIFSVYRHLSNPECRQFLLRQAFEEAIHTHTFQYIVESLGLDDGEIFNMYMEIPSVHDKAAWALEHTKALEEGHFMPNTLENKRRFVCNLFALYVCMESLWFYTGFAQVLSLGRRNKMMGIAEQYQYIMRDESVHFNFGIDAINQIRNENVGLWDEAFEQRILTMLHEAIDLEVKYAQDTMPNGMLGLNADIIQEYLQYVANRRCKQLNLPEQFVGATNPMPWMSEAMDLKKEKNFFETRVTEYQSGGSLSW